MSYFEGWFGDPDTSWWDESGPAGPTPAPSGSGGVSNRVVLATIAPRPTAPLWRQIPGAVGTGLTEVRKFLSDVLTRDHLWGNHVEVTFSAGATPVKIATGLSGQPKGYKIVRSNADVRVWDATPPVPQTDRERNVIWLQSSAAATVTLYIY